MEGYHLELNYNTTGTTASREIVVILPIRVTRS